MSRRSSITSDPDFQWIAIVIGLLLLGSFIYNLEHGDVVKAIISVPVNIYHIVYAAIFVGIFFIIVAKWSIVKEIIWNLLYHKKR